jgi:hypothetical protein
VIWCFFFLRVETVRAHGPCLTNRRTDKDRPTKQIQIYSSKAVQIHTESPTAHQYRAPSGLRASATPIGVSHARRPDIRLPIISESQTLQSPSWRFQAYLQRPCCCAHRPAPETQKHESMMQVRRPRWPVHPHCP